MSDTSTNIRFLPMSAEGAWKAYLDATRDADAEEYEHLEAAAWEQLQATLARLPRDPVGAA